VGVRLEFTGEPEAIELDYHTATADLGFRGEGAGTSFALYRGVELVSEGPRGSARVRCGSPRAADPRAAS